jgi:ADP-heptose:LPS heptosyltransferase
MRILLSRTDRIGDLILSTPAIATVRASFPDAHLTLITSKYNAIAVERNTDVNELVPLDAAPQRARIAREFKNYDVAIALAPRAADLRIVAATGAKRRIGYTYLRRWFARLTARLYVNTLMISEADPALCERNPSLRVRHEVDQLLDLVALAGAHRRVRRLRLDLRDEDRDVARRLPASPVVLHLGDRWFHDGSTLESTQLLLDELATQGPPLVVTTPRESTAEASRLRPPPGSTILAELPFFPWAAVFERAACVVTVDTGATHVASAVRVPTVVAFEHRYYQLNSQEWAPFDVPNVTLRKPASDDPQALRAFRSSVLASVRKLLDA